MISTRGSEWRKWDLHLHSHYTFLNSYNSSDEEFINKIKSENISCIGLTNYFKFHEKEYELKTKLEKDGITTFLNLELRLDYQNKEDDCLDFHVIFSNKVRKENIERFLSNMTVNINGIEKKLIDISNPNDFKFAVVSFDKLVHQLNEESIGLKDKYLLGFLSRGKGDARSSSNYEKIAKKVDLLIHSTDNPSNIIKDREFWATYNKPLLQNSDAHTLEKIGNKHTWIKAEPTFEGLKQIIYEPLERVKIQKEQPESDKLDNLMISKIEFTSSNNRFSSKSIYFNKNLNVIIGGKSSGKSILLYQIARTLSSEILDNKNSNEKLNSDVLKYKDSQDGKYKDLYDLSKVSEDHYDDNFNFKVELFSKSTANIKDRLPNTSSILPSLKYIPQNHLSNLVDKSRKNGATLKKLIRNLVLEDPDFEKIYKSFVEEAKNNDKKRNQDIDYYFSLKDDLAKKKDEIQQKGDLKSLNESIIFNTEKINKLNKELSSEELKTYETLSKKLNKLKIRQNQIDNDYKKLHSFVFDCQRYLIEYSNKKETLLNSIELTEIKDDYITKFQFIDEALDNINEIQKDFIRNDNNEYVASSVFYNEESNILKQIREVEEKLKKFKDKIENKKQVDALQKNISENKQKLAEIKQFEKEIGNTEKDINNQKQKILNDFRENFNLYEKIINDLKPRISSVQEETDHLEIIPSIKYNFPTLKKSINDIFNKRSFNNEGFEYLYDESNPKSALADINFDKILKSLKELFEKIETKNLILKKDYNGKEAEAVKKIFEDCFFDHWDVKSKGDDIHKMSTGKASFVLLKLIIKLSKDDGPILIDQPEDNLDNRSVSKELVEYLKEKKKDRQIILVTHNPNIVVNADAENIIVANQKSQSEDGDSDYDFDYINGSLENSFEKIEGKDILNSMGIRQHITEIVEGGKDAFKKREEKYGF